jgi:putative aldouronate transport system permease protein
MVSSVADVMSYYIYRIGILSINQYSYATAMGLFNSVLALGVVILTNYGAKKIDEDGGLW